MFRYPSVFEHRECDDEVRDAPAEQATQPLNVEANLRRDRVIQPDSSFEFPDLGQIIAGQRPGRTTPDQITLADLTGTGVQDTAIATLARNRALAANAGTIFGS